MIIVIPDIPSADRFSAIIWDNTTKPTHKNGTAKNMAQITLVGLQHFVDSSLVIVKKKKRSERYENKLNCYYIYHF